MGPTGPKSEQDDHHEGVNSRKSSWSNSRVINSLPLYISNNYSPYQTLDFDLTVQEYCRNRNNHISLNNRINKNTSQKGKHQTITTYDSVNTPFNKIIRNCKVVVSGDFNVGKTCLINRFGSDIYSDSYQTTIGVDFDLQRFNILGQPYVLQIWDTAGLEQFRCITKSYYRGCQVALLVFDVSNMRTLADVHRWKDEVLTSAKTFDQMSIDEERKSNDSKHNINCNNNNNNNNSYDAYHTQEETPLLFLVGTKCDSHIPETTRAFYIEQANKIAASLRAELWFVSAKTGENVQELFHRIAALSFNRCIVNEIQRRKFETSTMGACIKEKILQQQKDLWNQSSKFIKITKKKDGDDKRSRCVNVQCVIK